MPVLENTLLHWKQGECFTLGPNITKRDILGDLGRSVGVGKRFSLLFRKPRRVGPLVTPAHLHVEKEVNITIKPDGSQERHDFSMHTVRFSGWQPRHGSSDIKQTTELRYKD